MQASALCDESLALAREMENQDNIARALDSLGLIARHQDNHPQARSYHEEALALHQQLGDKREVARTLVNLASVAMDEGYFTLAHNRLLESLSLIEELGDKKTLVRCLAGLANVAQKSGSPERASTLLGVVQTLLGSVGISLPPAAQREHIECLSSARAKLSEAQWEATWAKGRSMTIDEAIAYALA
jgi:tetratricopeptide (TPR) repeat protein